MFIVIEGLDGAGKSTQVAKLTQWVESQGKQVKFLHFPRFDAPVYGELIAKFLRGEFGKLDEVHPQLVALLYAGDRADAKKIIEGWLADGYVVVCDRYLLSNVAYQCAKLKGDTEELKEWIVNLEYNQNRIPRPDVTIFLDVPFRFTKEKLSEQRSGSDRDYLRGEVDIHESSLSFQERVREVYLRHREENYYVLECSDHNSTGEMLPIDTIHNSIINLIDKK